MSFLIESWNKLPSELKTAACFWDRDCHDLKIDVNGIRILNRSDLRADARYVRYFTESGLWLYVIVTPHNKYGVRAVDWFPKEERWVRGL